MPERGSDNRRQWTKNGRAKISNGKNIVKNWLATTISNDESGLMAPEKGHSHKHSERESLRKNGSDKVFFFFVALASIDSKLTASRERERERENKRRWSSEEGLVCGRHTTVFVCCPASLVDWDNDAEIISSSLCPQPHSLIKHLKAFCKAIFGDITHHCCDCPTRKKKTTFCRVGNSVKCLLYFDRVRSASFVHHRRIRCHSSCDSFLRSFFIIVDLHARVSSVGREDEPWAFWTLGQASVSVSSWLDWHAKRSLIVFDKRFLLLLGRQSTAPKKSKSSCVRPCSSWVGTVRCTKRTQTEKVNAKWKKISLVRKSTHTRVCTQSKCKEEKPDAAQ